MYRNCIFCSALLGANEAIESFPVGTQIAFDSWKGRLWAVCRRCARWNLAPIEERWEPIEQAETTFRNARLRVQCENIGLARLPEGTRLIRIGKALPGELAAWRYGSQLLQRRNRYLLGVGGLTVLTAGATILPLAPLIGAGAIAAAGMWVAWKQQQRLRVLYRIPAIGSTTELIVRRWHVEGMNIATTADGNIQVAVRDAHLKVPGWTRGTIQLGFDENGQPIATRLERHDWRDIVTVSHDSARTLLSRALVYVNQEGADRNSIEDATQLLTDTGSAEAYLRYATAEGFGLGKYAGYHPQVKGPAALALEMAVNEQSERRALEGELAALEAAWREAEEIAAIADSLPDAIRLPHWLRR